MKEEFEKQTVAKNNTKDRALQEIKNIYDSKGLNYLIKLFGSNEEYINKILAGKINVPENIYLKIADETGCTYDYLIGLDNARNDEEREKQLQQAYDIIKSYKKPRDIYGLNDKQITKPQHPHKDTRAQKILTELTTQYSLDELKDELGLQTPKAVTNMANGNTPISKKHFPVIAKLGNCTLEYLYGTSDVKNNEDLENKLKQYEEIKQQLEEEISNLYDEKSKLSMEKDKLQYITLIKDNAKDGLNKLSLALDSSINEIDTDIKKLNDTYADIVSSMISDVDLWLTLIENADRLISTKTDLDRLTKFENEHNRNIDINYNYTTRITPDEIASKIITKPFLKHFFEYIATKEKELNIQELDIEAEENKKVQEILKYKRK